jgi:hypothetical protein
MIGRATKLALQVGLMLIFMGSAMPLHAFQDSAWSSLFVCNKGTVPVEVVIAMRKDDPTRSTVVEMMMQKGKYYWDIEGRILAPQACSDNRNDANPAYIAFGFVDSKGAWGSGRVAAVPDFGSVPRPAIADFLNDRGDLLHKDLSKLTQEGKVLTGAARVICARKDETQYKMNDDFQTDCATVQLSGAGHDVGHGPFFPLTSALLYYPTGSQCNPAPFAVCPANAYYLNIAPNPDDRDIHATVGTEKGAKNITNTDSAATLRLKQIPACNVITQEEAEAVLGVSIDAPEPGRTLCRYQEPGYGTDESKKKQLTIGIFRSTVPNPEAVNERRNFIINDKSLLPVTYKEVPNFGDTAFWVWAGGYYGALYVLKGGTLEIAVKISGVPEDVALATARKFATRALGGTGKTGFVYAARKDQ